MTSILGISAFYHDSAAALLVDGQIVAAAQEERFSRKKFDPSFPKRAIHFCLERAGLQISDLDYVVYYEKPFSKFERLVETYVAYAPRGFNSFRQAMPQWLQQKLPMTRELRQGLHGYRGPLVYVDHHESHAASAFAPSPFDEAAILTVDGVGEWSTTCIAKGTGARIEMLRELRFPHSLGLLYSAFTAYLGFRVNSGEYKVMGLAPYGQPRFADAILNHLIDLKEDGSFRLNMSYFDYGHQLRMTSGKFNRLFGGPPRQENAPIDTRHHDIAASIQSVTNEVMLRLARHAHQLTGCQSIVLAGGVALNCVANSHLLKHGPFENIWVQPAAGDSGGALGCAWFVWHQLLNRPRTTNNLDRQHESLLGPAFADNEILAVLKEQRAVYEELASESEVIEKTVAALEEQKVIGWFQDHMEFGPRALGARSIIADPRNAAMQARINEKVKLRETFRPFAPSILADEARRFFHMPYDVSSPYMLLTAQANQNLPCPLPAVIHVDGSARLQTVSDDASTRFSRLLRQWYLATRCPALVNTSFNLRGEPLVCSPLDAWRTFMATDLDTLVIGNFILHKSNQTARPIDPKLLTQPD